LNSAAISTVFSFVLLPRRKISGNCFNSLFVYHLDASSREYGHFKFNFPHRKQSSAFLFAESLKVPLVRTGTANFLFHILSLKNELFELLSMRKESLVKH